MANLLPVSVSRSLERLRDRISRIFRRNPIARRSRSYDPFDYLTPAFLGPWGPAVDVAEDDEAIYVRAEIPGLDKDDFRVEVIGDCLVISGEKSTERERRGRGYYYAECAYGSFSRSIPLPCEIDLDRAEARYRHGVLSLRLPKSESARAREIKVKVA